MGILTTVALSAVGFKEPVHVFISFAEQVPFGTTFRRYLGLVGRGTLPGPFNRVEGNFVSNLSTLWVARVNGTPFTKVPKQDFTLVLEFKPDDGGSVGCC